MSQDLNIHQKAELARQLAYHELKQKPEYKFIPVPVNVLNEKMNEFMQLSDKDLQAQINRCFSAGKKEGEKDLWDVMGLELSDEEKRRANLRMQNEYERLRISMSPDTEKTRQAAQGVEFRAGLREAGIPVEIPQETRTPEQEQAVAFLEDMAQAADENMLSQMNKDGIVGKAYNLFIKEAFDTEFAKSNVEEAIEDTKVDIAALRTTVDFEATFEERRGVKFDPQKIREVSEKAELTAKYQACADMVGALKSELSKALEGSKDDPRAGEKAILQTSEALGLDAGAVVSAALKGHEDDPAIKDGLKEGGAFAIKDEGNGKYGIYRETDAGLQPITQEQAEIIGKEMANILDKFEAQVLGTKIPENATSEEIAELNEARMEEIRSDYEKSFAEAYGEKDLEKLSQNYMMSQEKGKIYVQTGVTLLAMAGAMFTGGGSLALVSAAVLATNPVDLLEKSTDADGMTKDDWKNYGQSTLEQIGWMALGGAVGKVGDVARSFVKVKGLSKAMKESGKSFDDFMKLAAKSPDIPKDMAKSLKTVSRLANTAGVTTEVALDMAATMALQKDGATAMDWAMSIGGALVGTKLQKVMAPMSEDARVKYLMDTFQDFKLSEGEAKQLLKAMTDAESGAAPLKKSTQTKQSAVNTSHSPERGFSESVHNKDFDEVKSEIFDSNTSISDVLDEHDLWITDGIYNAAINNFVRDFYTADGLNNLKQSTNYYHRAHLIDSLPESFKIRLKEKGIDLDKMNAFLKEDINYDYTQKLPAQASFTILFQSFLANNTNNSIISPSKLDEFISNIRSFDKNIGTKDIIKEYNNLIKSGEFKQLSNDDKTIAKTVLLLNHVGSDKEMLTLVNNLTLPQDVKNRIINLTTNKNLINDLADGNIDNTYAAAVMRNKKDLDIAFLLGHKDVADKSLLDNLRTELTEQINRNIANHGTPVMQTFIDPLRYKTDADTGVQYVQANENDVFLVHSVHDTANNSAQSNISSLLQSSKNPSENNYISTSVITQKSEVFANDSAYGVVFKNRSKNTINGGIGQASGYNHSFKGFISSMSDSYDENATLLKHYFTENLENSGIKLTEDEYIRLFDTLSNKQYFSQITDDININGKTIEADILQNAVENANRKLADKIQYGDGGNNEVTGIVDNIAAIYARVDNINDVKPEIISLAKENNLPVILLGNPEKFKKYDYTQNPAYMSEISALNEKFKNKEISAPELMAAKRLLKEKYKNPSSVEHSPARTSDKDISANVELDTKKRGAVLEGGIRADELDEVAPFAKRLENPPHVGDYIPVPETKLNIKEFKNRLSSLRDKDNKPLVSDFTIEQYTQLFGAENLPNVSAFIDEARVKYGDEFVNHVVRSIAANNSLNKEDAVNLMRRLINEFDGTTENASKIISAGWLLNHSEAKAAQILLDMPKRTNSMDTPWPDAKSLLDNAGKFKDKKSVAALERAVSLKAENGLNIYDTKDIDSIVQAKELLTSDIYTDEEIKKLRFAVIGLYKNPADLEDVSKVLTAKENTELQAQVKDILKNSDGMKMFGLVRQLQPEIYEKITDLRLSSLEIPDKALKSLIKRNITKINDPQNRLEFLEQMQKYLPDLSEVQDKYILGKIHGETAEIVERLNIDGSNVTSRDYKKLETYVDIDKEFRGEETYSYGNASQYLSYMEKEYPDEAKVFKDLAEKYETMSADEFENYFQTQVGTNSDITPLHIANYVKDKKIETLKNFMRENYHQEGNLNYTRRETAHIRQLYEDKYLSTLPAETRECCQKIYDSFGVKIFVADENDTNSLNYIYNELLEWQKAGKGKATLPPILDLSVIKQGYIDKVFRSGGYHENPSHNISINAKYLDSIKHAIRHEIAHANDSKIKQKSGIITVYNKDGTEEEINIDEIIVHKTEQAKDADGNLLFNPDGTPVMVKAKAEDGTFVPDFDKCKYVDEFRNAGLSDYLIEYAYTDKAEFLAVAAEGDYSKYSKEFKELLVKLGLPDWMFKMKNKNNVDSQENLYFNEKFSDRYTPEQNQAISSNSEKLFNMVVKNKQKVIDDYDGSFAFTLPGTKLYKRIKDFEGVNEKIYRELDRIDKKIREISDIETYNATKLKPGDEPLTQEMADALIEKYNIQKQNLINNYDEVYNTLQDVFGARLVMEDCSPASVSKVFNALLEGIDSGKFKVLEINNYQGAGGIPYFSSAQIKQLQAHCRRKGYDVKIVSDVNAPKGREAEYQNAFNSAKAIKQSGYTTCQMNIEHSNGVISEFQIRGKHINELAESEHIFYDISQNKDLSRGNPQIKRITDPLVKVVEEMNAKGNEHIKEAYSKYLTECYKYARMQELGISMKKPTLPSEVDPILDIDNIIKIHEMIEQAK